MSKAEKILATLHELTTRRAGAVPYEDLVVAAFERYPGDFALRGYPQYPDASDIHKPIYNSLKPQGLVRVVNKTCQLTESGRQLAAALAQADSPPAAPLEPRLTRKQTIEIRRQLASDAVRLVAAGEEDDLIDTDCQRFYGFAPWTKPKAAMAARYDFLAMLDVLAQSDPSKATLLKRTDSILHTRFTHLFDRASENVSH